MANARADAVVRRGFATFRPLRTRHWVAMSDAPNLEKLACPHCATELDATDNFCRHCGAITERGGERMPAGPATAEIVEAQVAEPTPAKPPACDRRLVVYLILFLGLGPLGFPLLWRSRTIKLTEKIILTVVVTLLAAVLIWLIYWIMVHKIIAPFQELFNGEPLYY